MNKYRLEKAEGYVKLKKCFQLPQTRMRSTDYFKMIDIISDLKVISEPYISFQI